MLTVIAEIRTRLATAIAALEKAADWMLENYKPNIKAAHAGSVPFLKLVGLTMGGWQMARAAVLAQAQIAAGSSDPFYQAKIITSRFYADHQLTQVPGLAEAIVGGAAATLEMPEDLF